MKRNIGTYTILMAVLLAGTAACTSLESRMGVDEERVPHPLEISCSTVSPNPTRSYIMTDEDNIYDLNVFLYDGTHGKLVESHYVEAAGDASATVTVQSCILSTDRVLVIANAGRQLTGTATYTSGSWIDVIYGAGAGGHQGCLAANAASGAVYVNGSPRRYTLSMNLYRCMARFEFRNLEYDTLFDDYALSYGAGDDTDDVWLSELSIQNAPTALYYYPAELVARMVVPGAADSLAHYEHATAGDLHKLNSASGESIYLYSLPFTSSMTNDVDGTHASDAPYFQAVWSFKPTTFQERTLSAGDVVCRFHHSDDESLASWRGNISYKINLMLSFGSYFFGGGAKPTWRRCDMRFHQGTLKMQMGSVLYVTFAYPYFGSEYTDSSFASEFRVSFTPDYNNPVTVSQCMEIESFDTEGVYVRGIIPGEQTLYFLDRQGHKGQIDLMCTAGSVDLGGNEGGGGGNNDY